MRTSRRTRAIGAFFILISVLFATCDDFSLSETFYIDTKLPLSIFPANAATWESGSLEFVAQGGAPEYTFSVTDADGGTVDPVTGEYTAPSAAGEYNVVVTDQADRTSLAVVYVVELDPLRISPRSASVAIGETKTFVATGGNEEYTFEVDPTSAGTWNEDPEGTGTFTAAETGSATVTVSDGTNSVTASVYVYVGGAGGEVRVVPDGFEIAQGESIAVRIIGDSEPFVVSLQAEALVYTGSLGTLVNLVESPWEGHYAAGNSIGTVRITAETDPGGLESDSVIITVLPATPSNFAADNETGSPSSIRLNWDHTEPLPANGGFRIYRTSSSSATPTMLTVNNPAARTFLDETVSPSEDFYIYQIAAYAAPNHESRPSESSLPTTSKP